MSSLPDGPHPEARTYLVDGIPVGVLPNGTIDLGHSAEFGSGHMTARNLDATTAPLIDDCMIVVGHGDSSRDGSGAIVLAVDDVSGARRELSGGAVAEIISAVAPDIPGRVFLNVCKAGQELEGLARQLADSLNRTVRASPADVYTGAANHVIDPPWYMVPTTSEYEGAQIWFDFPPNDTRRVPVVRRDAFTVTEPSEPSQSRVLSLD